MLFSICIIEIVTRKEGKYKKEAGIGTFLQKNTIISAVWVDHVREEVGVPVRPPSYTY